MRGQYGKVLPEIFERRRSEVRAVETEGKSFPQRPSKRG